MIKLFYFLTLLIFLVSCNEDRSEKLLINKGSQLSYQIGEILPKIDSIEIDKRDIITKRDSILQKISEIKFKLIEYSGGFNENSIDEYKKTGRINFYKLHNPNNRSIPTIFFYKQNDLEPFAEKLLERYIDGLYSINNLDKSEDFKKNKISFRDRSIIESIYKIDSIVFIYLNNEYKFLISRSDGIKNNPPSPPTPSGL